MKIFLSILKILAFSAIMLIVFNVLRTFVLSKIKVKHNWIIIVLALIVMIIPALLQLNPYSIVSIILSGITIVLLLWYMDLKGFLKGTAKVEDKGTVKYVSPYDDKKGKKKDVIKPKAKPNKAMKNSEK